MMADIQGVDGATPPLSVFLSYARDDRPRALAVIEALKAEGFDVWWDGLLEAGDAFANTTETALETADAVVVLWSARSVQSHWVRDEATRGRDRCRMVPVSIDGTQPPLGFRQIQYVDLASWKGATSAAELAALFRAIRTTAAAPGAQLAFAGAPAARSGPSRRTLLLAGGGAVAVAGGLGAWKAGLLPGFGPSDNSIAVLPFKNLSNDASQDYFADGLCEEVRSALMRNNQLKVAAPTSSKAFRGTSEIASTIAKKLHVAFLLEGSVRRAGNVVRIAATLTDAKSGYASWSETFERKLDDVFAVQSEIAETVADELNARMGSDEQALGGRTRNVAAYDAYLRGRAYFELSADEASDRAALAQFDAALAADPSFALAYAARSRALAAIANETTQASQMRGLYDSAIAAGERAVALAPQLADAHLALGYAIYNGKLDPKAARASYNKAHALGAGDADVLRLFAAYSGANGRSFEAADAVERAMALDPLNARVFRTAGDVEYFGRRYAASIPLMKKALSLNPGLSGANAAIGNALYQLGRVAEAKAAYAREPIDVFKLTGAAICDQKLGDGASAKAGLAKLVVTYGSNALYQQAQVFAQSGDVTGAVAALLRARKAGDAGLLLARTDPMLDPLRRDRAFIGLLVDLQMM
jgi:TolB-like protein/Tfp pilus assembly protein PilF